VLSGRFGNLASGFMRGAANRGTRFSFHSAAFHFTIAKTLISQIDVRFHCFVLHALGSAWPQFVPFRGGFIYYYRIFLDQKSLLIIYFNYGRKDKNMVGG